MTSEINYMKKWEPLLVLHRPYLVSFAFRMTGSLSEAEDIVQDTFLECAKVDPAIIENPKSWLTKVCSNRGLDHLKLAYKKREDYHGTWLPDAVPASLQVWSQLQGDPAPDRQLILSESLTTSFLLLIEKLTPEERVVFLLAEVFEYAFKEIAEFLDKTEEACRKIAQRARTAVIEGAPKFTAAASNAEALILKFFTSAKNGDHQAMMDLLADSSEFWADGGGKVSASREILRIPSKIADFFKGIYTSKAAQSMEARTEFAFVNSRPGFVISRKLPDGSWIFDSVMSFEIQDNKIYRIYTQRNPDKLAALLKVHSEHWQAKDRGLVHWTGPRFCF
jgi:RNA polymerase sigma-70 factor, ECF subfamily